FSDVGGRAHGVGTAHCGCRWPRLAYSSRGTIAPDRHVAANGCLVVPTLASGNGPRYGPTSRGGGSSGCRIPAHRLLAACLWQPLRQGRVSIYTLRRVQRRRELPVRLIQGVQAFIQDRVLEPALTSGSTLKLPLAVQLLTQLPVLRVLPARLIAYGLTRPRVRTPAPVRTKSTIAAT